MFKHVFRGRTYQFEEFLLAWEDKLKAAHADGQQSTITVKLQQEVDTLNVRTHIHVDNLWYVCAVDSPAEPAIVKLTLFQQHVGINYSLKV